MLGNRFDCLTRRHLVWNMASLTGREWSKSNLFGHSFHAIKTATLSTLFTLSASFDRELYSSHLCKILCYPIDHLSWLSYGLSISHKKKRLLHVIASIGIIYIFFLSFALVRKLILGNQCIYRKFSSSLNIWIYFRLSSISV